MTNIIKKQFIELASGLHLGNLTNIKPGPERVGLITKISDMYCAATDENNEVLRNQTISALMLLFYGEISKMQEKCKAIKELSYEDFVSKLYECIEVAMSYRTWQKDSKTTAEACIRSCIASRGAAAILYDSNRDKNKANVNSYSLDDIAYNNSENDTVSRGDLVEDSSEVAFKENLALSSFIQSYLDKNKIIEGIILDTIVTEDCIKYSTITEKGINTDTGEEVKYKTTSRKFWAYKVVQFLTSLPENYFAYFSKKYKIEDLKLQAALDSLKTTPRTKLNKFLETTLSSVKQTY